MLGDALPSPLQVALRIAAEAHSEQALVAFKARHGAEFHDFMIMII
jgi:hypothetical protein